MKVYWILILIIFLSNENIIADNLYVNINRVPLVLQLPIYGSGTVIMNKEEILQEERRRIEIARKNFTPYECPNYKIGDKIKYSFRYLYFRELNNDFIGIVIKIEPKPTTEYIHWITVKRLSGSGTSGVYCEQFLSRY